MSWFQGNPIGAVLAGLAGLLVLASVGLGMAWNLPPSAGDEVVSENDSGPVVLPQRIDPMQPVENYAVIVERPVFNESRRPEIESEEGGEELVFDENEQVADPGVRLTGVVLTPDAKIVTLTPKTGDPIIVREGTELEGEQVGWAVSTIGARQVTLSSRDGQELQLDLVIHDEMIAEPPEPEPEPVTTEEAQEAALGVDGEPISRAEEIRQRIQERREQLRREALEAEGEAIDGKAAQRSSYQEAIRAMMARKNNEKEAESGEVEDEQE